MKHILHIAAALVLSAFVAGDAAAQWNVARFDSAPNRVYTTFGIDPSLVMSLGYARVIPVVGHAVQLTGEVGVQTGTVDTRDARARFGAQTSLVDWRSLRVTGSATGIARGTENAVYRGVNFGADFTGTIGVYRPRWFAAGEIGKDKAVITHVTHTDWYRTISYADARDGWYLDAGGTIHYGIAAGVSLGRAEVAGRFGLARTEDYNSLAVPLYASIGVGFAF